MSPDAPELPPATEDDVAHPTAGTLQRQAVRGSLWSVLVTAVNVPLTIASLVVVARSLGPGEFGHYAFVSFVLPLVVTLTDLGVGPALSWSATSGRVQEGPVLHDSLASVFTWSLLKAPLTMIVAVVLLHGSPLAAGVLGAEVLCFLLAAGWNTALGAERRFRASSLLGLAANALTAVASVVAATFTGSAAWTVVGAWTGRALYLFVLAVIVTPELRRATTRFRFALDRKQMSFAASSYVAGLCATWALGRSEIVFLRGYSRPAEQGRFAVATTISSRATLLADSLFASLSSTFLALAGGGEARRVDEAFQRALRLSVTLAIATAVVAIPIGSIAGPAVFGTGYGHLTGATLALLVVSMCTTAAEPLALWIYVHRDARAMIAPGLIATIVDVGLCVVLIPRHGLAGAVAANAATGIVLIGVQAWLGRLPRAGRADRIRITAVLATDLALCATTVLVPLPLGLVARALVATALCVVGVHLVHRLTTPPLDTGDAEALADSLPGALRGLTRTALRVLRLAA
jgi:O-antigen/teichoic acid export membrane protein